MTLILDINIALFLDNFFMVTSIMIIMIDMMVILLKIFIKWCGDFDISDSDDTDDNYDGSDDDDNGDDADDDDNDDKDADNDGDGDDDDGDAGRVDDSWVWRPLPRKTLTLTSYSWLSHLLPHHRCCPFSRRFRSWNSSNHFSFSVHLWSKWQSQAEKKNIETGSCKCVPGGKIGETDFSICLSYW